ncbi:MAG: hypothetical protein U0793_27070 [Gemmataceae bacterium]
MLRVLASATMFLGVILAAPASDGPETDVKEFATDIGKLTGTWMSPKMTFAPGVTGHFAMKLEFNKGAAGQASVLSFVSRFGISVAPGPSWSAELKEKDKKRFIVLTETKGDKRTELTEMAYEVMGNRLKLTSSKTLLFEKRGNAFDLSGVWERKKADKK